MEYVKLPFLYKNGEHDCNSLRNAIESLDELGACMTWATLTKTKGTTILNYWAWTYRQTPERGVKLPFLEDDPNFAEKFKELLYNIFTPFDDHRFASLAINVVPHPTEVNCFIFTLTTSVGIDKYNDIANELESSADAYEDATCKVFYLD
jgi:hypothetical protein